MPVDLRDVAEEMREKFPGIGFWVDRVRDFLEVSRSGYEADCDFTIRRKDVDDNVHVMKCERMIKALAEPYPSFRGQAAAGS